MRKNFGAFSVSFASEYEIPSLCTAARSAKANNIGIIASSPYRHYHHYLFSFLTRNPIFICFTRTFNNFNNLHIFLVEFPNCRAYIRSGGVRQCAAL